MFYRSQLASASADPLNNYLVFNDSDGVYSWAYEAEKKEDCLACSRFVSSSFSLNCEVILRLLSETPKTSR